MASDLQRVRRRVAYSMILGIGLATYWFTGPGLPVWWGPRASAALTAAGKVLFEHEWTPHDPLAGGDGLGPVFNAKSCVACHFQGGVGGGGPNQHNVVNFEVLPTPRRPQLVNGLIHHFAIAPALRETGDVVRRLYPMESITEDCRTRTFDPVRVETINSTALFGAGWLDRVSDRSIQHNHLRKGLDKMVKELRLEFDAVPPGRPRVLADGRIGKFGWRGQFATLKEFVAAACANELGLGNPLMEQARPLGRPDYAAAKPDLNEQQFSELTAFVDTLPRPREVPPAAEMDRAAAAHGKRLFFNVGCILCHVPDLGGVEGMYSDLLLHELEDVGADGYGKQGPPARPLPDGHPRPTEWKTPPLWGVADSAPYFHDGQSPTLEHAIERHRGDAALVTKAYHGLSRADQQALIGFLKTLKAPATVAR